MPKTKAAGKAIGFIVKYIGDFFKVPRKLATKAIKAAPPPKGALPAPRPKIDPSVAKKIKAMPKGSRPDPSTYLSKADIDKHLQPFKDSGAVKFVARDSFQQYKTLGPPGGSFAISMDEFQNVLSRTGGDLGKVERELGLNPGALTSGDTMIARVRPGDLPPGRVPSGNEIGANAQWEPGGFTSGGVPEATFDFPKGTPFDEIVLE